MATRQITFRNMQNNPFCARLVPVSPWSGANIALLKISLIGFSVEVCRGASVMSMPAFCLQNLLTSADARKTLAWEFFREGVQVSWIYRTEEKSGPSSAFLKYEPGAEVPLHSHTGLEHILMLEGSQTDENGTFHKGDIIINPPGTRHSVYSRDGCEVLAVWHAPVKFV